MSIKQLLIISFCTIFTLPAWAQEDAKKINASLNEATVFFQGAELVHKASSSLTSGVNEIWITNLSPNIELNSLKVAATNGVMVTSFEYSHDYLNKKAVSTLEKNLKDSIKFYQKRIEEYNISINTNNDLLEMLKANKSIGGSQTGVSVTELTKMVDYYSSKSNDIHKSQNELREKNVKAGESVQRLQRQLQQESAKNVKYTGVLKLNLNSPMAANTYFTITYYTANASWAPYYNINVPSVNQPIQIASKAKVRQTTGLDWTKVKLTLSSAVPSLTKEAPLFNAWFLDYAHLPNVQNNTHLRKSIKPSPNEMAIQNSYSYDEESKVEIRGESNSAAAPLYILNGVPISKEEMDNLSPDMISDIEVLKDKKQMAMYGSQGNNGVILVTTKSMDDFVKRDEGELNMIFNIDLPYNIEGNGKVQNIDLQTQTVEASFKHYAVPKLAKETFLLAEIKNWQQMGLMTGQANVTFDGVYVGETTINASATTELLTLTLGTDSRVVVKREKLQDYSSHKFLGKDVKQEFTYKITVKNNQNKPINLTLKDQYPISKQKDIEVELSKDITPTTLVNEAVGVLVWNLELGAGQSREFKIAYSVKYPKDRIITDLN